MIHPVSLFILGMALAIPSQENRYSKVVRGDTTLQIWYTGRQFDRRLWTSSPRLHGEGSFTVRVYLAGVDPAEKYRFKVSFKVQRTVQVSKPFKYYDTVTRMTVNSSRKVPVTLAASTVIKEGYFTRADLGKSTGLKVENDNLTAFGPGY